MNEEVTTEVIHEIISWTKTVVLAVIFAIFINNVIIVNAKVPTGSMMDNILPNDRIVAFRLSYLMSSPKRFDIVVFRYPDDRKMLYVKRIIGLPGETVTIRQGKVYIDDSEAPLDDSFIREPANPDDFGPYTVPANSYFMMGDNRNTSMDSRYWVNTYVIKSDILGKVLIKYFPGFKILYNT
ncbi:MAG: signal peptidase I [Clostridiales bacterium]|jgi:signal peptidase I|nr:signal peptidase I [Clostridiales bacterium]